MAPVPSLESRLPKMYLPGELVGRYLNVENSEISVTYVYDDGLRVTFWVEEDRVRWEANRPWRKREDGVVLFEGCGPEH